MSFWALAVPPSSSKSARIPNTLDTFMVDKDDMCGSMLDWNQAQLRNILQIGIAVLVNPLLARHEQHPVVGNDIGRIDARELADQMLVDRAQVGFVKHFEPIAAITEEQAIAIHSQASWACHGQSPV